jgi:solute carrier family 25 oxoglutarate transporter 11
MQNDASLPPNERRNYKGVFDAFRRISAEEGFLGLWKGATPTIVRACALK